MATVVNYVNCTPAPLDVTVEQTVVTVADAAALFKQETFVLADVVNTNQLVLAETPAANAAVTVVLNGAVQRPNVDYTISGNTLSLNFTLGAEDQLLVSYLATA